MKDDFKQRNCFTASWAEALGRCEERNEETIGHCTWDRCHGFSNCNKRAETCSCGCGNETRSNCDCGCGREHRSNCDCDCGRETRSNCGCEAATDDDCCECAPRCCCTLFL